MNIYTVRDNIKNTIKGKRQLLDSMVEPKTGEALDGWTILHNMLAMNIEELERILADVEVCCAENQKGVWSLLNPVTGEE